METTYFAKKMEDLNWINLNAPLAQLNCHNTLVQGQCFSWFRLENTTETTWVGNVAGQALAFKQAKGDSASSYARLVDSSLSDDELDVFVRQYFQLDHDLEILYEQWAGGCPRMKSVTASLPGVRVLRQEPWECLISFICSSNNNIKRITQMLDRLKLHYGSYSCSIVPADPSTPGQHKVIVFDADELKKQLAVTDGDKSNEPEPVVDDSSPVKTPLSGKKRNREVSASTASPSTPNLFNNNKGASNVVHLYNFPTINSIAQAEEADLRALGMGYRAKFLRGSGIKALELGGSQWLEDLRRAGPTARLHVNEQLQQLPGVGRKVADCVALFSLDQTAAVPVDVHVYDIAARDYDPSLLDPSKASSTGQLASLTPKLYERVGDLFRSSFGEHAGWAHSVLFAAELSPFRQQLSQELQKEMDIFDAEQRSAKKVRADAKKLKKAGTSPAAMAETDSE